MKKFKKLLQIIMNIEITIGAIMIIFISVAITAQVFMRYVINRPFSWVQEAVMLSFIWATMLGASVVLKIGCHIKINTFIRFLNLTVIRVINMIISIVVMGTLIFLVRWLPAVIRIQNMSYTSALPINIPRGLFYSLPIFVSVLSMMLTQIYFIINQLMAIIGKPIPDDYKVFELKNKKL